MILILIFITAFKLRITYLPRCLNLTFKTQTSLKKLIIYSVQTKYIKTLINHPMTSKIKQYLLINLKGLPIKIII